MLQDKNMKKEDVLQGFQLILGDGHGSEYSLEFEVLETATAKRWFNLLKEFSGREEGVRERKRFYHFSPLELESELESYNELVRKINEVAQVKIPELETQRPPSQEELNFQHRFFEDFRGSVTHPHSSFLKADHEVRQLWEDFNVWIHKLEDMQGTPRLVVTFQDPPKIPLTLEDYQEFTLDVGFGDVFINYCQVGKHPLEAYLAKDNEVAADVLRPLEFMSADFRVRFCPDKSSFVDDREKLNEWLRGRGLDPQEPRLGVGWIPVARLDENHKHSKLIDEIAQHQKVLRVEVKGP